MSIQLNLSDIPAADPHCDCCGAASTTVLLQLERWSLGRCVKCGLVRLVPWPTADDLSAVYDTGRYYTHEAPRVHSGRADWVRNAVLDVFWSYPNTRGGLSRLMMRLLLWPLRERAMPVDYPGNEPVLDVGCGNGQRLLELQRRGCMQLYGVEPTEGAADQARKHTCADIRTGRLDDAGLPDNFFELIIMNQVLEHVPSPAATLRTVHRMLKPGGSLYLTVPNYASWEASFFARHWSGLQVPVHLHHFSPAPLRKLIEGAGFQVDIWRTDTSLDVTMASVSTWFKARPNPLRNAISRVPRFVMFPATLLADKVGRGQMIRAVITRI